MLTGYPSSCTLGRSVLGIGSGVARFLMIAEYATYRYLRCVVNVMLLLSQLSVSSKKKQSQWLDQGCSTRGPRKGFEWPAGLFRNYQYYQLNCYVIYGELTFREIVI